MIDIKKVVASELEGTGLPVYYELFVDSTSTIPCITYYESSNSDNLQGDSVNYTDISMLIKVWAKSVAELELYAALADGIMKNLGFTRLPPSNQTFINGLGQYILRYQAIGYEK